MKKRRIIIFATQGLLCLFLIITLNYAWYTNGIFNGLDGDIEQSYFAGGDGSKDAPYKISNEIHLYNLAWLQDLGIFQDSVQKQYYFELNNDINMSRLPIPSIGTETHPFIGNFNGNGHVIKNITISNKLTTLQTRPDLGNKSLGSCIGLFGVIGEYKTALNGITISNTIQNVSNFYIDNITVESNSSSTLIGLIAGYVNGNLSNVGVYNSKILLPQTTYISTMAAVSDYSLIGYFNDTTTDWADKPNSGTSFGASLDITTLYRRLIKIYNNKQSSTPSSYLPSVDVTTTPSYSPSNGYALPLLIDNEATVYEGSNYKETVSQNNIGYFTGTDVKIEEKNSKDFLVGGEIKYYQPINSTQKEDVSSTVPDNIKTSLNSHLSTFAGIRLNSRIDRNNYVDISGELLGVSYPKLRLPKHSIWFVPKESGKMRFVVVSNDSSESVFSLHRLTRETPGDYSSMFNTDNNSIIKNLFGKVFWYYEFDAIAGQEYALAQQDSGKGVYFVYLDIGTSSGSGGTSKSLSINNIDFVYYTVGSGYNVINSTTLSGVSFKITSTSNTLTLYFRRDSDLLVLYYLDPSSSVEGFTSTTGRAAVQSDISLKT